MTTNFTKVATTPAYQQVADQIAEAILIGDLRPGESLPTERHLSHEFGVSRATIREAVRALEARRLVFASDSRTRPPIVADVASGLSGPVADALAYLVRLRQVRLQDLVELRCALEAEAVVRASERGVHEHLVEAHTALAEMESEDVSAEDFHEADVRFHLALAAACGNHATHLVMLGVRDSIARHLLDALQQLPDPAVTFAQLAREHRAILDAVESGNGQAAAARMREHIAGFYREFIEADDVRYTHQQPQGSASRDPAHAQP